MILSSWVRHNFLLISFIIRVLLVFSHIYTDIDYIVYSDAAQYVYENLSPYRRTAYRYSPLLAWLLVPNVFFRDFGKIIFCLFDILCYNLVSKLLVSTCSEGVPSLWSLNPVSISLCIRGSSDSISNYFMFLLLYFFKRKQLFIAGLIYGFLLHFRIYPIIYLPSFTWSLLLSAPPSNNKSNALILLLKNAKANASDFLQFIIITSISFASLCGICCITYGQKYFQESLLYHFIRVDFKHNFSFQFYSNYLNVELLDDGFGSLTSFALQFILLNTAAVCYSKQNLEFCLFLQTFIFVTINKVITAQYFSWYMAFLPLITTHSMLLANTKIFTLFVACWLAALGLWLFCAYFLEYHGVNVFVYVWCASHVFYWVNVIFIIIAICHHS